MCHVKIVVIKEETSAKKIYDKTQIIRSFMGRFDSNIEN